MRMKKILTLVTLVLGIYCAQAQTNAGAFASMKLGEPVMFDSAIPQITTKADASSFAGGSGTEADPYLVATVEHLKSIAAMSTDDSGKRPEACKGIYFKQVADIVFGKDLPIIGSSAWFSGTYDGNGYAMKNINVVIDHKSDKKANYMYALFGNVRGATLKNIRMVDMHFDRKDESLSMDFVLAGLVINLQESQMINCTSDVSLSLQAMTSEASDIEIGGLAYNVGSSTIDNCQSSGDIYGAITSLGGDNYVQVAGIAAIVKDSKIINCVSNNKLEGYGGGNAANFYVRAGGIAVEAKNSHILNSCSRGESLATKVENKQEDGKSSALTAGIATFMQGDGLIDNCWTVVPSMTAEGSTSYFEPNLIGFCYDNTIVRNSYGFKENQKSLRDINVKYSTYTSASDMMTQSFVDRLNENLPEGALTWQLRKDDYPALQALHNVTLPLLTGATTTPGEGISKIEDGERFRFTLTLDEEYNESKPVVTIGDKTLEPDADMNYVTDRVTADMVIKITGIVKNTATANEKITTGSKVYVTGGVLYIQPEAPVKVSVFNMQGRLIKSAMISGDTQMQLPQGIYVVRLNDQSYKVSISE